MTVRKSLTCILLPVLWPCTNLQELAYLLQARV